MRALRLACLAASLLPVTATAQSLWPRRLEGPAEFGLEWVRPTFDGEDPYTFARGIWILDARLRAGKRINVQLALPQVIASTDAGSSTGLGNLYAGVQFTDTAGRPEFSLGIRRGGLGTIDENAWDMGFGDFDRIEEVMPGGYAISGIRHFRPWTGGDGAFADLRLGGSLVVGEEGGAMFFDYGVRMGRDGETFGAGFAWTGRWAIGSDGGTLASTIDQLTLDLSLQRGVVRPNIAVRVPFDENLNDLIDYALIVGARVVLK
jgi:hypothetical protein